MLLTNVPKLYTIYFLNIQRGNNFTAGYARVKNLYLAHEKDLGLSKRGI
jgi:hypothetical protein